MILRCFFYKGKISVYELAEILPAEENFLLIFRRDNPLDSSIEFMKVKYCLIKLQRNKQIFFWKVWRRFDSNGSGYIEADELQEFIKYLLSQKTQDIISNEKLLEYTDSIVRLHLIYVKRKPIVFTRLLFFQHFIAQLIWSKQRWKIAILRNV